MMLGRVVGNVWATKKEEGMENLKLLIVQPIGMNVEPAGSIIVAADRIGAGMGEIVIMSRGTPARLLFANRNTPIDAVVVGIVDSYEVSG